MHSRLRSLADSRERANLWPSRIAVLSGNDWAIKISNEFIGQKRENRQKMDGLSLISPYSLSFLYYLTKVKAEWYDNIASARIYDVAIRE